MLTGWFDAFRNDGGPTLYHASNRTPVVEDIRNILIYISFSTLFVAFLIVFPGIRKERLSTFICVTISLFVGAVILITNFGSEWRVGVATISSPYRAFSTEKISADIGVHIGLNSVNITLKATPVHRHNEEINYNERFYWVGVTQVKDEYRKALVKGLPFPILTIAEYLSQDIEGFSWGRRYRLAGYYTYILLWTAFALWLLMNVLLCSVPRYGAYIMQLTGAVMVMTNALYAVLLPRKPLAIQFEGGTVTFRYGWCYWLLLAAGIIAFVVGAAVAILDTLYPNTFSTILEVDYDTPYRYFVGQDQLKQMPHPSSSASTSSSSLQSQTYQTTCRRSRNAHASSSIERLDASEKADLTESNNTEPKTTSDSSDTNNITETNDIETKEGIENAAFEEDRLSDDGSTIVDGKRAVSLQHFEKYAQKEAARKTSSALFNVSRRSPVMPSHSGTYSKEVTIDIHSAALW